MKHRGVFLNLNGCCFAKEASELMQEVKAIRDLVSDESGKSVRPNAGQLLSKVVSHHQPGSRQRFVSRVELALNSFDLSSRDKKEILNML
jgi:hypothetical protein